MTSRRRKDSISQRVRHVIVTRPWILPALGALVGVLLAAIIGTASGSEQPQWTISVDRARDTLLSTLGFVFTAISIVLALGSVAAQEIVGRFGSRTLRIYTWRSPFRWVVSMFTLTATFILVEQYQLRGLDSDRPAPVIGLLVSVLLLVFAGALLIWYIGSVVHWFRTDTAVAAVVASQRHVLDSVARRRSGTTALAAMPEPPDGAVEILAPRSGYLAEIDTDLILETCGSRDIVVAFTRPLGAVVFENDSIGWIAQRSPKSPSSSGSDIASFGSTLGGQIEISRSRDLSHNPEFRLVSLVDIAIIALSPAVNDPNSAVEVIEEMGFLFPGIARIPTGPYASPNAESWPRVLVAARTFDELVEFATRQIVLYGKTDPNVVAALRRLVTSLDRLDPSDTGSTDQRWVDKLSAELDSAREA
jgi:uncharacterized membrane protein